jgi:ubiquinone/menaquinone biosynthesis C-methylase UbiE
VDGTYHQRARYDEQAATSDTTRSASPTVVRLLLRFLGEGRGRTVLDVAGGTGNYARALAGRGFRPVVVDRELAMLARAVIKIGPSREVVGDAMALPVRDASVDVVVCVSALHQFPDQRAALAEMRRVIRDGPLVMQVFTAESLVPSFVYDYFPDPSAPEAVHLPESKIAALLRQAGFGGVEHERFVYEDVSDGTVHALQNDANALADPERLRNTSFFRKLDPSVQEAGLSALQSDLRSGALQERVREGLRLAQEYGQGAVFAAWPERGGTLGEASSEVRDG